MGRENKEKIKEIQKILNETYNYYVFKEGSEFFENDEEQDKFVQILTELQDDFDKLYKKWGYEFYKSYYDEPLEIK